MKWIATPAGIISIAIVAAIITATLLGIKAGLMISFLFLGLGVADYILGKIDITFSQEVNRKYHSNKKRFFLWVVLMAIVLGFGLYSHFTGV